MRPVDEARLLADVSLGASDPCRGAGFLFLGPITVNSRVGYLCCVDLRHTTLDVQSPGPPLPRPLWSDS